MHPSTPKLYKTLPGPLRGKEEKKKHTDHHTHSPLFGLNLNLNFSNLITSSVNFFDALRRKTPSTPTPDTLTTSSNSSCSLAASTSSVGEAIEMKAFPCLCQEEGTGAGHCWKEVGTHNPTWCDLCGEMIWGLYAVGAWQCDNCSYTSHIKCRDRVLLDCSANLKQDNCDLDEDDTDGQVQSICRDAPDVSRVSSLSSFPSYNTARSDFSLPALSVNSPTEQTLLSSEIDQFHTLHNVESLTNTTRDEFHTLQGVEELSPDKTCPSPSHPASLLSLPPEELNTYLALYNSTLPPSQSCVWDSENNVYNGYIRVDMNLARPINVISGTRPPSTYSLVSETSSTINDRTLTTFYLPPGTERALHITSQTTTQDVIRVLLKKFRVADNPHKYALYERHDDYRRESFPRSKSLSRLKMRRLQEDDKPLVLAILWGREEQSGKKFVLQENDPGEIQWEQFSLPELKNFLLILDREEAWYKRRIHEKYETVQEEILKLLQVKREEQY